MFDAVVAIDSGADQLLRHGGVSLDQVTGLVHGAMFTRGPADLKHTAIFVGGSDVSAGEELLRAVTDCFFGPMRVAVMMDASGANTTSAAAVVAAKRHIDLSQASAVVLGGTGPVGPRVARLLAGEGAQTKVVSRSIDRAAAVVSSMSSQLPNASIQAVGVSDTDALREALRDAQVVVSAGAAGVTLLPADILKDCAQLRVAIDLNAVPPLGIEGIDMMQAGQETNGVIGYGAIGVGGTKMKIHKAAIRRLFESNEHVLDVSEIYELGLELDTAS